LKKLLKLLHLCIWLLAAIHTINTLIFYFSRKKPFKFEDEQFYDSCNGEIRYLTAGEGKPLLLIHGLYQGASVLEWKNSIESLSKHYKVYAIDLLGHGASAKPKMSYSAYLYTSLINDFIEDVIQEKTYVAANGHSAAFAVAAQSFKPDNFEKLMLINPTGIGSTDVFSQASDFYGKLFANMPIIGTLFYLTATSRASLQYFLRAECFSADCEPKNETVEQMYYYAHKGGSSAKYPLASLISKYLNVSIEAKIQNIDIPVHVVWGTDCESNPLENAHILEDINSSVKLSYLDGGKLLPHAEFSEQFDDICVGFFRQEIV